MFVANVNGCTTKESVDIRFPQAGDNVVHLAVADTVEPGPGEGVFASLDSLWDFEVESVGTPMFVANVNGCTTKESVDIRFPQAGDNVEYKGQPRGSAWRSHPRQ
jgi:hypothetical protein